MSMRNFVYSKDLERSCGQYSVTNCRCDVSAFDLRKSMCRLSNIDVSTFEDRCGDFRRSMCRLSKIDVATFEDRCIALRRSTIGHDVSTFEDRCVDLRRSMCWPSKIDDRRVDLRRSVIDVVDLRRSMVDVSAFEDRWSM